MSGRSSPFDSTLAIKSLIGWEGDRMGWNGIIRTIKHSWQQLADRPRSLRSFAPIGRQRQYLHSVWCKLRLDHPRREEGRSFPKERSNWIAPAACRERRKTDICCAAAEAPLARSALGPARKVEPRVTISTTHDVAVARSVDWSGEMDCENNYPAKGHHHRS